MKLRMLRQAVGCFSIAMYLSLNAQIVGTPQPGANEPERAGDVRSNGLAIRNARYQLRPGDSFDVSFALAPEFDEIAVIQPDGFISLKGADSIPVQGKTLPEATQAIKFAYAKILHDPLLSLSLKDFEKPYFVAAGKLSKPGKYDLRAPLTVSQGVAIAGGFTEDSKTSQVVLFHPMGDGTYRSKLIDVKHLMKQRLLSEDAVLQPGDMVYVPQSRFSYIRKYLPTTSIGAYAGNLN